MSSYVDYYTDDKGDLFIKYFLIDDSFNARGWSVDPSVIPRLAKNAIGKPFTDYRDFTKTMFDDGHPWSMAKGAAYEDHLAYGLRNATGIIVDISPVSQNALKSAGGEGANIAQHHGYYATVKVTDPKKKELYRKNPSAIPKVSPGIIDYNNTPPDKAKNLNNVDIVHLAGVEAGAYGDKARLYATCSGGYECVNHLKGASTTENGFSSLTDSSVSNNNIMSEVTKQETPQPQPSIEAKESQNNTNTTPVNNNTGSPIERLKKIETPTIIKEKADFKEDPEYKKLLQEHEELKKKIELEEYKKQYSEVIPRELFILNGKFDSTGYSKEIEKAVEKKIDPEFAKELYTLKLKNLQMNSRISGKPYGASTSLLSTQSKTYETPSTVPDSKDQELKGASTGDSSQFTSIKNLCKMFNLNGGL